VISGAVMIGVAARFLDVHSGGAMIHLSANGELLGQFEESALPQLLASGKLPAGAFYWREGMKDWLPVEKLAVSKLPPKPIQALAEAPVSLAKELVLPRKPQAQDIPRRGAWPSLSQPEAGLKAKEPFTAARATGAQSPAPGDPAISPDPSGQAEPVSAEGNGLSAEGRPVAGPLRPAAEGQVPLPVGRPRRSWILVLFLSLVLAVLAAGGAWWWLGEEKPPEIAGSIVLPAGMTGPVEVRVYRRADLATPWREFLASAEARAAELGGVISEAAQAQREKELLFEQASRVHETGVEYNMPDVEELKAERDALEVEFAEAQDAVRKLQAEQQALFGWDGLLGVLPPPLRTVAADEAGEFNMLRPGEDEVLLLAVGQEGEGGNYLCWLTVVEALTPEAALQVVEFSDARRLDLDTVRRIAGGEGEGR